MATFPGTTDPPAALRRDIHTHGRLRLAETAADAPPSASRGADTRQRRLVERTAVVRRLATARVPLALLIAPAGYGKTTVLDSWEMKDDRPFARITGVDADNDPAHLLTSIVRALDAIEPLGREVVRAATAPGAHLATDALPLLIEALGRDRRPSVLVLDDADAIHARKALDVVAHVAAHLGSGSIVAIASRAEPALPIGVRRAEGAILELRGADLAMTEREAALLLRRAGVRLDPSEVTSLVRRTEGWPVALNLAALALRHEDDAGTAAARFAGDDRLVADYLWDQLLPVLSQDELTLLVRTSPLDRLSGPLCDAVLGRSGTGGVLRSLARAGLPLTAVDRCEHEFRLHRVVAEMLRAELRRTEPALELEVHRTASAWHEQHGDIERAIDHALSADDNERVAALLWRVTPSHVWCGRGAAISGWLNRLHEDEIASRPPLALALATTYVTAGERDEAERWTATAERRMALDPGTQSRELLAAGAALRAAIGRDGAAQMRDDAERAIALSDDDSPWRAHAYFLHGTALQLTGDEELGRLRLEEGARAGAPDSPTIRVLCLAQLALSALQRDDEDEATRLAERARSDLDAAGLAAEPACALVLAVSAFARAQNGTVLKARDDVTAARRLAAALTNAVPWYDAEVRVALARAELRLSDAAAARSHLAEASRALRRLAEPTVIQMWIDDAWARADTFAVGAVSTPTTLTTAELRVLRFLPSHLSFREIAGRLHVSANTVKTQAHAVYRKLDASSRSEAVGRARDVGLVDA